MKAVRRHIKEDWILLYVERWLTAPLKPRREFPSSENEGHLKGGVVSPTPDESVHALYV